MHKKYPLRQFWNEAAEDGFQPAEAAIYFDEEAVCVEIEAVDSCPENPVRQDNEDAWTKGDVLEVFLQDPHASHYTEWHVTPEGHLWRKKFLLEEPGCSRATGSEWISEWGVPLAESRPGGGRWTVSLRIPWTAIQSSAGRPGHLKWAVCRYDYPAGNTGRNPVLSATAPFLLPSFHRKEEWMIAEVGERGR